MAKKKFTRSRDSDKIIIDANLKADKAFAVPVFTGAPGLNNNPIEAGYIGMIGGKLTKYDGTAWGALAEQADVDALIAALVPHPTYNMPVAVLSSTQSTNGHEVGEVINIPLTESFIQNDAGAQTGFTIEKNGTQIATANTTDFAQVMSLTPIVYLALSTYAQGPVKNNIIGVADPVGRITAGTVGSNFLSYVGLLPVFFFATDTVVNSGNLRSLAGSGKVFVSGATIDFPSGNTARNFYIWVPPGHTLSSWIDFNTNADLKSPSVNSSLTIADAGSGTYAGTLWHLTAGAPFPGGGDLFKFNIV
jgi:hypothetical protein